MSEKWYDDKSKRGKLIATGFGVNSMLDKSYNNPNMKPENSILWVKDESDFGSQWKIYEKKGK